MSATRKPRRAPAKGRASRGRLGVMLSGLIDAGVIDTPFEIERRFDDQHLKARVEADGSVSCMGRNFGTLSSAASYARSTCPEAPAIGSRKLPSNGWSFWQYRGRDGELRTMRHLRRRFLRG